MRVEAQILAPDGPGEAARLRRAQAEVLRELTLWMRQHGHEPEGDGR